MKKSNVGTFYVKKTKDKNKASLIFKLHINTFIVIIFINGFYSD